MKKLPSTVAITLLAAAPALTFAQQAGQSITRNQVRAELDIAQKAWGLSSSDTDYPLSAQQASVAIEQARTTIDAAVGGVANESQVGSARCQNPLRSIYFGH